MFNRHANVQHIDLKVPLFGRGSISEELKSIFADVVHVSNHWILTQAMALAPVPNFDVP